MDSGGLARGRSWKRIDGIDLLRALAIFFVLMNHVNIRLLLAKVPYLIYLPHPLANLLVWNAQRGVQIFFAVSGFLITSTALRRWHSISEVNVREFYLLRFARIAPLLLLIVAVLSVLHLGHVNHYVVTAKTGGLGRAILAALSFHVNVLEARRGYLPGNWDILWSLSVEEMFYLFFPLVCFLTRSARAFSVPLLGFILLGPFARAAALSHGNEIWHEYSYLGSMDAIALGCLTALVLSKTRLPSSGIRLAAVAGASVLCFSLGLSFTSFHRSLEKSGLDMSILAVGTCLVMMAAAQSEWRAPRIFRPVLTLGRHSYEIYLTHMFLVFAAFDLFLKAGKPMAAIPVFFISVILVAGLVGNLVAHFYSEPMNQLIRSRIRGIPHAGTSTLTTYIRTEEPQLRS